MEYWLHFLSELRGLSGTVIHAGHCHHRFASGLGRKPVARDGSWVGPFSEDVTEKRFVRRSGYHPCRACCPQAWLPRDSSNTRKRHYGSRKTLSAVARRRNASRSGEASA
jgi:hypothetical protein